MIEPGEDRGPDFIRQIVAEDLAAGRREGRVVTRFPPEPNGFLHVGHAKSICLNFGVAEEFGGRCHLRFDDTNPTKEEQLYIDAIREDIRWLGFDWGEHEYYASDYFEQLYDWACQLIDAGLAYVDDQSAEAIRASRGTLSEPGSASPYRDRSPSENLALFRAMRAGEFPDGSRVLRAKIDMGSPNINLRDPVMYRILTATHPRTGEAWRIYPMYDFAHGQSDSIERITHSLCTLEFADHRPLYDWFCEALGIYHPQQIEFARLNLTRTVMSKRKLLKLVTGGHVAGWDDPRMPTLSGMRRRGYPPEAIRSFCAAIGVSKRDQQIDLARLEHAVREVLNRTAPRAMAVLDPLKLIVESYPEGETEAMSAVNNPEDAAAGNREVPFSRELFIERADFMEEPVKGFHRLSPGSEVRLRAAYLVTCTGVDKDEAGRVVAVRCRHDPASRGGDAPDGRKVKGTLHWVSAAHAVAAEARLYDHLFLDESPDEETEGEDWLARLNPDSLRLRSPAYLEPSLAAARPGERFQFERLGYFVADADSRPGRPVFNRTVTLRDSWAKQQARA